MYVELLKALYGTLRAARLFWEKLQGKLVNDWGFVPNRYDSCVVNKIVNGKQHCGMACGRSQGLACGGQCAG